MTTRLAAIPHQATSELRPSNAPIGRDIARAV